MRGLALAAKPRMDGVLLPAQLRIDLADLQRQREMRRLEEGGEDFRRTRKDRFAGALLFLGRAALADAEVQVDEGVFGKPVGDRIMIGAKGAHPHRTDLEKPSLEHGVQQRLAECTNVGAAVEIGRIFDGEMWHPSSHGLVT